MAGRTWCCALPTRFSTQDDVAASLVKDYRHSHLRHQGRRQGNLLFPHCFAALDHKPQITMDDGADLVTMILTERQDLVPGSSGRDGGNHDRRHSSAQHGERRRVEVSHRRRERRGYQAFLRQPLRHGPIHPGRNSSRHQRALCRPPRGHLSDTAGAGAAWRCAPKGWART